MSEVHKDSCDLKKAGGVEFRCYFQLAMAVIGGKWKPKVLFYLSMHGPVRFGALRRAIFGITEKMLIQSLKELERDGLVIRHEYPQVPPKVEYSLSEIGQTFVPQLTGMYEWGKAYASFLVAKDEKQESFKVGEVYEDIDKKVTL